LSVTEKARQEQLEREQKEEMRHKKWMKRLEGRGLGYLGASQEAISSDAEVP
jgi:hypothetical protein